MEDFILALDSRILLFVNSHHSTYWDYVMLMMSSRTVWIPFYAALLYAVYLSYGWRTMILMGVVAGIAVGLSDQISASLIRPLVERLRPANLENILSESVHIVDGYRGGRFGFPSCHAANTFATATLTSLVFRRYTFTAGIFLWAASVCYSRMYLGVHYPGDILAGAILGTLVGALCYGICGVLTVWFVRSEPGKKEARRIVATYKRGLR